MEGLLVIIALLLGTLLAIGISMAGLHLILSFVPAPTAPRESRDDEGEVQAART